MTETGLQPEALPLDPAPVAPERDLISKFDALIAEQPDNFDWVAGDVTDPDTPAQIVAATLERFGRLDILVNNAGVADNDDFAFGVLARERACQRISQRAIANNGNSVALRMGGDIKAMNAMHRHAHEFGNSGNMGLDPGA